MLQTVDVDVNPEEPAENVDAALATTTVCGSSFCSSAAAVWAAADADAAVLTADANPSAIQGDGVYHSVLFIL